MNCFRVTLMVFALVLTFSEYSNAQSCDDKCGKDSCGDRSDRCGARDDSCRDRGARVAEGPRCEAPAREKSVCEKPCREKTCNDQICEKEYGGNEPVQREVCKELGADCPEMRDCLRDQRSKSGGGRKDTMQKNVERHVKCAIQPDVLRCLWGGIITNVH